MELCMLLVDVRRPRVLLTHKAAEARGRWEGTHARTLEVVVVGAAAAAVVVVVVVVVVFFVVAVLNGPARWRQRRAWRPRFPY